MCLLEWEALGYWRAARDFRLKSSLGADTSELEDDLTLIAANTRSAVIRRDVARMIGFDVTEVAL